MVVSSLLLVMFSFWWHYHHDSSLPMVTSLSHGNIPPLVTLSQWQLLSYGDVTLCNDSSLPMVASSPLLVMFLYWWHNHNDSSLPMVTSLSLGNVPPWWHYHSDRSLLMLTSLYLGNVPSLVTLSQWQFPSYGDVTLCNDSSLPMVASSPLFFWKVVLKNRDFTMSCLLDSTNLWF